MRRGSTPEEASSTAISRIAKYYPDFSGAVIAVNKNGDYATACNGMTSFPYIVAVNGNVTLKTDACVRETGSGARQHKGEIVLLIFISFLMFIKY